MFCINCQKETTNKKFCSRSCANAFNNSKNPKRKPNPWTCRRCGKTYERNFWRTSSCLSCREEISRSEEEYLDTTLGEFRAKYSKSGIHRSWWYSEIRKHARKLNKHRVQACEVCGYSICIEHAHILPLAQTPDDWTLLKINSPDNIKLLCPNHHWEFDHQLGHFENSSSRMQHA
ncbi:MAG: HNH endonuclease signature motif containing protein [Acidiferrobacterales bacterium]